MTLTRGIRNNNPGNIRHDTDGVCDWIGVNCNEHKKDKSFCTFNSMELGCRALIKLLMTYYRKYKCDTITKIISRWAPSNENDTNSYIKFVAKQVGIDPTFVLYLDDNMYLYLEIAKAIAYYENGEDANSISESTWEKALSLI